MDGYREDALRVHLDSRTVSVKDFVNVINGATGVLTALLRQANPYAARNARWVVTELRSGSAGLTIVPPIEMVDDPFVARAATSFIDAATLLQEKGELPASFPEEGIGSLQRLMKPLKGREPLCRLGLAAGRRDYDLLPGTPDRLDQWLSSRYREYGSVEGRIDLVNVHDASYCTVYSQVFDRPIRCQFKDELFEDVRACLKRLATVTGWVTYNASLKPVSIEATAIRPLRLTDADIPEIDLTGGVDSVEHMRWLRDE